MSAETPSSAAPPSSARLRRAAARCAAGLASRFAFHSRGNIVRACVAVALLCGMWALLRGQDANWDLRNYHLYNGYAALGGRLALDLAPAQMQSYFHPALDVLQYLWLTRLPAPLAGFALGALHGLVFALVAAIAWRVLADDGRRALRVPLLALAGTCTAAFVSELGNTMADNTTALPVLAALALGLRAQARQREGARAAATWLCAGLLLGLAVALKLTNALYAVALGLAALADGGRWRQRWAGVLLLTLGAALCFACVGAPWFWKLWQQFGNPLFPQFNAWFQSPLASPVSVGDTRWRPQGVGQWLSWPLLFSLKPLRVSEVALPQFGWALLYLMLLAGLVLRLLRRAPAETGPAAPAARVVAVFVAVAYLLWQSVFGIHRYLVAIEVLTPLLLWWLWPRLLPAGLLRWRGPVLALAALFVLFAVRDWGHEPWRGAGFEVAAPAMPSPSDSVVVLVGGEPQAWRLPFLPAQASYLSLGSNFPAAPAYAARAQALLAARPQRYAMLHATVDRRAERLDRLNDWVERLGWSRQPDCHNLRWWLGKGLRAELDEARPGRCRLRLPAGKAMDVAAADAATRTQAATVLEPLGWRLQAGSCQRMPARIGDGGYPYQWCRLEAAR